MTELSHWPRWVCPVDPETGVHPYWSDLTNECIRDTYTLVPPVFFVICVLLYHLVSATRPRSTTITQLQAPRTTLCSIFQPFLTLEEAEAIEYDVRGDSDVGLSPAKRSGPPLWKTTLLVLVALAETMAWTIHGCYTLFLISSSRGNIWSSLLVLATAASWVYATIRPVARRRVATPTYDLLVFYIIQFIGATITTGSLLFCWYVYGDHVPRARITGLTADWTGILLGLGVLLSFPMGIPSSHVDAKEVGSSVSPEDFTTVWGWFTFTWVGPLLKRGSAKTLNESDVWRLSSTLRSKPLFTAFSSIKSSKLPASSWGTTWTLAKHLLRANSRDLALEAILTFFSVFFDYLGPFFLKRILDVVGRHEPEMRAKAYVLAGLAFVSRILKAQADAQHMWYGRRASTRTRSEIMAAVYDKALKRKDAADMSGKKDKDKSKKGRKEKKDPMKQEKAGIGKIVQVMSADANRVGKTVSGAYYIYAAPFELFFACILLYQILGWSAFAGCSVLILAMPLNHFLSKRSVVLTRGLSHARDKRMSALNELILGVKFIKFFAWESQWIARITKRRQKELTWLKHERINQMMFNFVWQLAPTMVAVVSFLSYVALGNELTISVAFTSIALFNMLKNPLNIIPQWIVTTMQAGVSLSRIAAFLSEEEVPEAVSSLKGSPQLTTAQGDQMRIVDGSFVWNSSVIQSAEGQEQSARTLSFEDDMSDDESEIRFELLDVDLAIPEGKLTLITGPTASGKSALLMALLGEMTQTSGELYLPKTGGISFAAQSSWLEHKSIKDNILFGTPYDEERYNLVLECCALKPDLEIFEDGDLTEIGARGVSLSGGQKARVALARAVYAPTKRILLDDPLAAVDSHTTRFLIDNLFKGPLLQDRTVVLVTHHVELMLPCAHYLVRMYDGQIDMQGIVSELQEQGQLDYVVLDADASSNSEPDIIDSGKNMIDSAAADALNSPTYRRTASPTQEIPKVPETITSARETRFAAKAARQRTVFTARVEPVPGKGPRKLVQDESRAEGNVKWRIYKTYLKASGYFSWVVLVFLIVGYQGFGVIERLWLKQWGEAYDTHNSTRKHHTHSITAALYLSHYHGFDDVQQVFGAQIHPSVHYYGNASLPDIGNMYVESTSAWHLPSANSDPYFYVGVYAGIVFAAAVMATVNSTVQFTASLRASKHLFNELLRTIVYAPIRYFDITPAGRILNRFGRDVQTVDSSLSSSLRNCSHWLATFFAGLLTVSVILPPFLLPAAIIAWLYYLIALKYVRTARDLKRMESNSRSPIFSSFAELLEGIVTVRAFSAEQRFFDKLHKQVDDTNTMWYHFWMLNRWLLLHFDALASLSVFITTIFAISVVLGDGLAAVTITTAMSFTQSVYWCCRTATSLEMDLNSVERVVEYLDLPQEPSGKDCPKPPAYWPSNTGDALIAVENLVMRYSPELDPVLHGVSFKLRPREKVGLLGRTGSGKSTLAMSFLRFADPSEGSIRIDGLDITKISLQDLRSKITIIPQDPVLFSGTVRENLDPFRQHTDAECIDVLQRVQLTAPVISARTTPGSTRPPSPTSYPYSDEEGLLDSRMTVSLKTRVSAGGANFSQGQRQLFSLARALLRRNSIVIMDESTSSLDYATDQKIQTTIREEFEDALTITVAHRIRTIIDNDRLMVLDKGHIIEFDTPWNLIEREGGLFREMCLQSGMFSELRASAAAKAGVTLE